MKKKQWPRNRTTNQLVGLKKRLHKVIKDLGRPLSYKKIAKLFIELTIIENNILFVRGRKK